MFRAAEIMILNKTDLLPLVDFDVALAVANARQVNPDIRVFSSLGAEWGRAGRPVWLAAKRDRQKPRGRLRVSVFFVR
jgi:Ni2+-binding GTPase involved in maturation of urease and hydrogenase